MGWKISKLLELYNQNTSGNIYEKTASIISKPLSSKFLFSQKINALLEISTPAFNKVVFKFLKGTKYPVAGLSDYPLIENDDVIVKEDVIRLFKDYGITYPKYYRERV